MAVAPESRELCVYIHIYTHIHLHTRRFLISRAYARDFLANARYNLFSNKWSIVSFAASHESFCRRSDVSEFPEGVERLEAAFSVLATEDHCAATPVSGARPYGDHGERSKLQREDTRLEPVFEHVAGE